MTISAAELEALAHAPILLVATDFDGTIAPLVSDPSVAEANREALVALRALADLPQTHVAIVSGRALADLAARVPAATDLHLVGSHGSEFEIGFARSLSPESRATLDRVFDAAREAIGGRAGVRAEEKPASLAIHYRNASDSDAAAVVDALLKGPATWPGVHVRHGKKVVELSVVATNKGVALQRLRQRIGATATIFLGDDATDEDAFATLSGPDLAVKVGEGATAARGRVADAIEVARVLATLAELRTAWASGAAATPIHHHALLSDQRTVALVNPRARVVWMCLPRIDAAASFAALLGGPTAGYFEISPTPATERATQCYLPQSFVLETAWPTLRVIDYLDCGGGRAYQRAGRTDLVRVVEGRGRVRVVFSPRLDFGRMETRLAVVDAGIVVEGLVDSLALYSPGIAWKVYDEGRHQTAVAEFDASDKPVVFELRYGTASLAPAPQPEPVRRERTARSWSGWAAALTLPALAREHVLRSALVLKALTYGPSGAIVAAATTSLPEHFGGVRNWDYRFCWPRDAAMAATALLRLGAMGPGVKLLDWVLDILEHCEPDALLSPIYTVSGAHLGPEGEIGSLSGYRGSRPVRVGNAAAQQVQLDTLGPLVELVARLADGGATLSAEHWRLVETMAAAVRRRWREPDHGIWEVRRPRRQHVHSKVMCWLALDRALHVARYLGRSRPDWAQLRDEIAADVLERGWNAEQRAFVATYEGAEPDAAALWVGLSGLLDAGDPRFVSTVDCVERQLRERGTVFRYRYDDGLPGREGGFHLCTAWLIEAFVRIGRRDAAYELFDRYLACAGPTGLLAEEVDPHSGAALGNFPQAYAHVGLIDAALALDQAAE